jgi:purine-binding chemotaxis protein CheW
MTDGGMMTEQTACEGRASLQALAGKFLTFQLGGEEYGLEILKVREIIGMLDITYVPQTERFVRGVINLRGKVIPVIDLRRKFGLEHRDDDERTCTIVVEVPSPSGQRLLMGIVVDQVSEVVNVRGDDIEPTPSFGSHMETGYILGMAKVDTGVKILLAIDRVVGDSQLVLA